MKEQDDLLLRRRMLEDEISFDNEAGLLLNQNTTINNSSIETNNPFSMIPADQMLDTMGGILEHAYHALDELTSNDLLGTAIFRGCRGLADAVGHLANELEQQSEDDRRALADACLQDVQEANRQGLTETVTYNNQQQQQPMKQLMQQQQQPMLNPLTINNKPSSSQLQELSTKNNSNNNNDDLTIDDIVSALTGASTLLRDVEMGFRGIEEDEAEEIADVALTLAKLCIASLESVHSSIVQDEEDKRQAEADRFELLEDNDDADTDADGDESDKNTTTKKKLKQSQASAKKQQQRKQRNDRLRVLWPPLGPALSSACAWGQDEATKQPLLAVALGITLWPAAVITTFVGTPLVLADALAQHSYNSFEDGPIVSNVEKAAAQAFQAGKLSLLCGKLAVRQSLRVVHRQVDRNGGIKNIAQNLGGMAVDRALHPIDTIGSIWDGLQWGLEAIQSNLHHLNSDTERQDAAATNASDDVWQQ